VVTIAGDHWHGSVVNRWGGRGKDADALDMARICDGQLSGSDLGEQAYERRESY